VGYISICFISYCSCYVKSFTSLKRRMTYLSFETKFTKRNIFYIVKNVSLCKFGFKRKISHSSFQRCKTFHITRTITNKTDGNIPHVFVDFDMFYKSAHHFLYPVWRAWNTKLLAKCQ
jgi:hypothetical protein